MSSVHSSGWSQATRREQLAASQAAALGESLAQHETTHLTYARDVGLDNVDQYFYFEWRFSLVKICAEGRLRDFRYLAKSPRDTPYPRLSSHCGSAVPVTPASK